MSIPDGRPAAVRTPPPPVKKPASPVTSSSPKARALSGLDDQESSDPYDLDEPVVSRPAPRGRPCPSCTKPLPSPDATFCVECGYNLKTGQKSSAEVTKPKKPKKRKPSNVGKFLERRLTSSKFLGGMFSLIGGTVWLVVGLMGGRLFFYPIFLILGGIVSVFAGLISGDD